MNKAYSTKALPPGTVLREWRLEEVLGVGGFGIVYKGRGIYFNELVAIKEYFPSSISERDAEATVVPIDSNAEEVHALGLKKFVEEAKLLWNLSTPSRHPNIVSVRSLFEIHGTAYMVMDFEDGTSLSRLLKQGQRWNERSLLALVTPIAEGLDRAHRVGVLHRDIKPPNILINDSGRPVLIDFGSARFEAAEATSTKVTFHTPPYAAIEQYVKTFEQGPWTDIYALGVVLYECVTGEKPPEVLERMHASAGQKLADGEWPGYSKRFLAAVDAAMAVKPDERPQSIGEWLALLDGSAPVPGVAEAEEDLTQIAPFDTASPAIVPIAPPAAGFVPAKPSDTGVPDRPSKAEFKRLDADKSKRKKAVPAPVAEAPAEVKERVAEEPKQPVKAEPIAASAKDGAPANTPATRKRAPLLAAGGALALVAVLGGAWALQRGGSNEQPAEVIAVPETPVAAALVAPAQLASDLAALGSEAREAKVPEEAAQALTSAGEQVGSAAAEPAQPMAREALAAFAAALMRDAEGRQSALTRSTPWAASASAADTPERQLAAGNLEEAGQKLRASASQAATAAGPVPALAAAREALTQYKAFAVAEQAIANLARSRSETLASAEPSAADEARATLAEARRAASASTRPAATTTVASTAATKTSSATTESASSTSLSPATSREFYGIVDDARGMAKRVIRMGEKGKSGSSAADELLRSNAQLARSYDSNLATLRAAFGGVRSDKEAARLIAQAKQTRAYLVFLVGRSSNAR